jgi:hypothetical protein
MAFTQAMRAFEPHRWRRCINAHGVKARRSDASHDEPRSRYMASQSIHIEVFWYPVVNSLTQRRGNHRQQMAAAYHELINVPYKRGSREALSDVHL